MVKNVLGRVFALWAILVFSISLLLILIPIWINEQFPEPKRSLYMHNLFAHWMKFWFVMAGVKRIFKGREQFKKGENYVVVCNHNSFMDVPLVSPGIPGPNRTIGKIEMSRIPVFGIIYRRGSVLVDRKSDESRKLSYIKMKDILSKGMHMCIYPEGTRNKTAEPMQRFHDGAFKLAVETGKPVIPAVIFYTTKVLPQNKPFFFWPHRVEMHFLPQVSSQNTTQQELKEKIFEQMKQYYVENKKV